MNESDTRGAQQCATPPRTKDRESTLKRYPPRAMRRVEGGRSTRPAIHDLIAHANEHVTEQRFSEEIGKIVYSSHVGNLDHVFLHLLADEEMPTFNVLNTLVMLGIVC